MDDEPEEPSAGAHVPQEPDLVPPEPLDQPPVATVLLVEDDPDIRDLYTMAMEGAGIAVVAVHNGQEALDAISGTAFDLVVTDMWMPRMSGLDLCRKLRADPATNSLPVLMLSAYGRMRGREEAMMVGATEYVAKPVRPSLLISRVDALLGGRIVVRGG